MRFPVSTLSVHDSQAPSATSGEPAPAPELRWADVAQTPDPDRSAALIAALRAALPAHCVLAGVEQTRPYECDGLSAFRQLPVAVCLPENEQQVQQALRICREHDVPVVARGSGTSLSGGAMPHASGVVLSLDLDAESAAERAEALAPNSSADS